MSPHCHQVGRLEMLSLVLSSPFGPLAIVWRERVGRARVKQVLISTPRGTAKERLQALYPEAPRGTHPTVVQLAEQLLAFLHGGSVEFRLESLALEECPPFQRRVLLAEYGIPRGWVSTYGLIAGHLGSPRAARAVGQALARNPFPLVIPCHRAIAGDGGLGGFQGGLDMKRRLLEMEGVQVSPAGRVVAPKFWYRR